MAGISQDAVTVRRLRRGVGVIGIALPFVLILGHFYFARKVVLAGSISQYYYTEMRDVFVGGMCAMGVFLICYRYARPDDILSTMAGVLAIAVAIFHTTDGRKLPVSANDKLVGILHLVAAAGLLLLLAVFCFFLFPRRNPGVPVTRQRRMRTGSYYVCGTIIVASLLAAGACKLLLPKDTVDSLKLILWCEVAAVLAWGAAWLIKGETLFKDPAPSAT
jgi:hypothetical protein